MICERCQGSGKYKVVENKNFEWYISEKCNLCNGNGETDWITEIFKEEQIKSPFNKRLNRHPNYYVIFLQRIYPNKKLELTVKI